MLQVLLSIQFLQVHHHCHLLQLIRVDQAGQNDRVALILLDDLALHGYHFLLRAHVFQGFLEVLLHPEYQVHL